MLNQLLCQRPREAGWDDHGRTPDRRAGDESESTAFAVDKRPTGESAVRFLRHTNDAIELRRATRAQGSAHNGDIGHRGHDTTTPGAADGNGEVADTWIFSRRERRGGKVRDPHHGNPGGQCVSEHLALNRAAVWQTHARPVISKRACRRDDEMFGEDDTRDGTMMAVHLNDRGGRPLDS